MRVDPSFRSPVLEVSFRFHLTSQESEGAEGQRGRAAPFQQDYGAPEQQQYAAQ